MYTRLQMCDVMNANPDFLVHGSVAPSAEERVLTGKIGMFYSKNIGY